jgi:hypothetical protein
MYESTGYGELPWFDTKHGASVNDQLQITSAEVISDGVALTPRVTSFDHMFEPVVLRPLNHLIVNKLHDWTLRYIVREIQRDIE